MKSNSSQRRQGGFTLLEIMVVLAILGVLISFVAPNVMGNKDVADRQKVSSDIVALENALDMYKLENNHYPTTAQGLDALVNKPSGTPTPAAWRNYIRRLPDDPWDNAYLMLNPGEKNAGGIDIFSVGRDGQAGTEDDMGNWETEA